MVRQNANADLASIEIEISKAYGFDGKWCRKQDSNL
jgi:hypothetical protein